MQLVKYQTAKLAKECDYFVVSEYFYGRQFPQTSFDNLYYDMNSFGGDFSCFAPIQSQLQKWIREKFNLDIIVTSNEIGYGYLIYQRYPPKNITNKFFSQTYEESLEEGLKEALGIIKSVKEKAGATVELDVDIPTDALEYLKETYKKISFGRTPTKISKYGGSLMISFSDDETYRFNIQLYKSNVTLDEKTSVDSMD